MNSSSSSPTSINDLVMEILSRLPSKSVARFRCVSKLWASMLSSPYFKDLFMTRSSAKPRLFFAVEENGVWSFLSLPQLENPYEQSTLVTAAEYHLKFSPDNLRIFHDDDNRDFSCGYASGLFYIHGCRYQGRPLICNPITGRYAILPCLHTFRKTYSFFGFDPIDRQYKALSMAYPFGPGRHKTLTIGDGDMKWRKAQCSLRHEIDQSEGICINGVLYYLGDTTGCSNDDHVVTSPRMIVCFDLRSEKITFISVKRFGQLINYKGKLALMYWGDDYAINELHMWILDDVEKHEWSKYAYTLTDDKLSCRHVRIAGATTCGEIVFAVHKYTPKQPFYVFYFNPERNTLRRAEVTGLGEAVNYNCTVLTFVNHIEDLDVNDLNLLKSVHPPLVRPEYVEESDSESEWG